MRGMSAAIFRKERNPTPIVRFSVAMPSPSLLDPEYCRQRAAEVRQLADEFADDSLREILLQMAESYEAMAALGAPAPE